MSRVRIEFLQGPWTDKKTGRQYLYFRRPGTKRIPLPLPIGSKAFWQAYQAALERKIEIGQELRSKPGTVSASIAAYYVSPRNWEKLSAGTQRMRRAILENFRETYGQFPLRRLNENFIDAYLDVLKPHAARNHLKALRGWLKHAKHDVTRGIEPISAKSAKRSSWTPEQIAQFEAHHAIGTKARLAFAIPRFTGLGRSEVARIGPQHIRNGEIIIARQKTGVEPTITIHPELQAILDATAVTGFSTFLVTKTGRPFQPNDLSEQFRQWCNEAGLPRHLSLHGLRHTMGDKLAETGSSPNEIASVLGHAGGRSALHYTQGADRKRMGRTAMKRLIEQDTNPAVSNHDPGLTLGGANALKDDGK
jgi:integrase